MAWEDDEQYPEHGAAQSMWPDGRILVWDGWGPPALPNAALPPGWSGWRSSKPHARAHVRQPGHWRVRWDPPTGGA